MRYASRGADIASGTWKSAFFAFRRMPPDATSDLLSHSGDNGAAVEMPSCVAEDRKGNEQSKKGG